MKKLLLLILLTLPLFPQQQLWKSVVSKVQPSNLYSIIHLREKVGTGFVLGWNNPATPDSGSLRYLSGVIQFYDGSAWKTVGVSDTGIIMLNGLNATVQTLSIDTTDSGAPAWSSIAANHELNLPFTRMKDTSWSNSVSNVIGLSPINVTTAGKTKFVSADTGRTGLATIYKVLQDSLLFHLKVSPQNTKFVSPSFSTLVDPFYSSIQSAIDASNYGGTVLVYPATYSEYVQFGVEDSGKVLMGLDNRNTLIDSIYVQAKDVIIKNITIEYPNIVKVMCLSNYDYSKAIKFFNCGLNGTIQLGNYDDSTIYKIEFYNCDFINDITRDFVVNMSGSDRIEAYSCRALNLDYNAVGGVMAWINCNALGIDTLRYITPNVYTQLIIDESISGITDSVITLSTNISAYHILAIRGGQCGNTSASMGFSNKIWQFEGRFEIDIINTNFYYPNIVFNSTVPSRFIQAMGHGWLNPNTITGTGLSNLYINNSTFRMDAPEGLGADMGNGWRQLLDN